MEAADQNTVTRAYKRVTNQERANLINMVESSQLSISRAAGILGINYTNAMSIMWVYRRDNRAKSIRPIFEPKASDINMLAKGKGLLASLEDRLPP